TPPGGPSIPWPLQTFSYNPSFGIDIYDMGQRFDSVLLKDSCDVPADDVGFSRFGKRKDCRTSSAQCHAVHAGRSQCQNVFESRYQRCAIGLMDLVVHSFTDE